MNITQCTTCSTSIPFMRSYRLLVPVHPSGKHQDEQLEVVVHARGDERQLGSGGRFEAVGDDGLHHVDAA
jgi:hypothetical protein